MMKNTAQREVVAIRHVHFEDLGSFEPQLISLGCRVRYVEATTEDLKAFDFQRPDVVVVLGGPIGVYEQETYPFLRLELEFLRKRIEAGRPTLGICLGCQLIAEALGGKVHPGHGKEIGWTAVRLTEAGLGSPLRHLAAPETPVLHWHGDTFTLPNSARVLASTDKYTNQAFSLGDHVLALQFHLEVTQAGLESWFIGHACEISHTPGISVAELRVKTASHAPALSDAARRIFADWLARVNIS